MNAIYVVPTPSVTPAWDITLAQWLHGPEAGTRACAVCATRFVAPKRNRGKMYCGRQCARTAEYRQRRERIIAERNAV